LATANIVRLTDTQGVEIAPQTLTSIVVQQDGQTLENLILSKINVAAYVPTDDYNPATKGYVDNTPKTKIIMSGEKPQSMNVGDIWYELYVPPYTFSEVDSLGYTFEDVDNLGLTWKDANSGNW
jgi:hypothetical protein